MKSLLVSTVAVATLVLGFWQDQRDASPTDAARDPAPMQWSMHQKLHHGQAILDGLVTADFEQITQSTQRIRALSLDDNWRMIQTEEYLQLSTEFRRTVQRLEKHAHSKNLDGASLQYLNLIGQCFQCHNYVRNPEDR